MEVVASEATNIWAAQEDHQKVSMQRHIAWPRWIAICCLGCCWSSWSQDLVRCPMALAGWPFASSRG
eukprot:8260176-Karenia_brevis.AAC.1